MASMWPPKKNVAFTLSFTLYKNDGTIVANPGTYTKKVSIDGGAVADIAANVTEEDTTYGQLSLVLASGEMNGDAIWIYITDNTAGTVPFTCTLYTTANTQDEIGAKIDAVDDYLDTELAAITAAVITNAAGTDIAADIIAVKNQLDVIQADTDLLDDAAGGLADIHTDLAGLITDIGANGAGLTALPDSSGVTEILTRIPDATAGAAGGLPTVAVGGAKLAQTVDLTAGQTISIAIPRPSGVVVADAGNSVLVFKTDLSDSTDDYWINSFIKLTSGAMINQTRRISSYDGTAKTITVSPGFTGIPAAGVTFVLVNE